MLASDTTYLPLPMHLSAQTHYQAELDAGRFCIQRCPQCQNHVFTPRELCPHCGTGGLRWVRASGLGTVYSTSTIARKQDAGGNYNVALIDLDEGVRMMSRVEGDVYKRQARGQGPGDLARGRDGREVPRRERRAHAHGLVQHGDALRERAPRHLSLIHI